ncbi:hypothetical protein [Legionella sp.]|uniref:hypothetical protein n=1 Tax=Legionella sp. TaxID=459 RepID=UPI003C8A3EEB
MLKVLQNNQLIFRDEYYGRWNLSFAQSIRMLRVLNSNQSPSPSNLLKSLSQGEEPMQTVIAGVYYEDYGDFQSDENNFSLLNI